MGTIKVGIADDHKLFRKGLISILRSFEDLDIIWEADNGEELLRKIGEQAPDIALVDISMPRMNGIEATAQIKKQYSDVRVIALSMYDDEANILAMLQQGANSYLLKDSEPDDIYTAIKAVSEQGIYHTNHVSKILTDTLVKRNRGPHENVVLNDKEKQFLKLVCKELTNKEIADVMCVSDRTIDGYRDKLLEKLNVKNRIGLVLFAIKHGIADME